VVAVVLVGTVIKQLGDLVDAEESVRVEDKDQNDLTG
jgi:hypothetical protein